MCRLCASVCVCGGGGLCAGVSECGWEGGTCQCVCPRVHVCRLHMQVCVLVCEGYVPVCMHRCKCVCSRLCAGMYRCKCVFGYVPVCMYWCV